MATTPRAGLPFLATSQVQKEVVYNEALTRLDALTNCAVQSRVLNMPPSSPSEGQAWLVGPSPTGLWAGKAGQLALYYSGWVFITPYAGLEVFVVAESVRILYTGSSWVQTYPSAAGGGPPDVSFLAHLLTSIDNFTGDGTNKTIIFNTVNRNVGDGYNSSTGVFIAPLAGLYHVHACIYFEGVQNNHNNYQSRINTTGPGIMLASGNPWTLTNGEATVVGGGALVQVAQGDYIRTEFLVSGGSKVVSVRGGASDYYSTWFSGYLVREL